MYATDLISKLNNVRFENITLHLIFLNKSQVIVLLKFHFLPQHFLKMIYLKLLRK
jgi:hypothetical protein